MFALLLLMAALTVGTCVLACWRGGAAERLAGAVIMASIPLTMVLSTLPQSSRPIFELVVDGAMALTMLVLTLVYASRWLGAIMLLYAAQFTLHAYYFVAGRESDALFVVMNNLIFFSITVGLFSATLGAMGRRKRELGAA
jgi:hypothetical protein